MEFFSVDSETRTTTQILEPNTLSKLSRISVIAIGRWLLSGLDAPDAQATDGVSEFEATFWKGDF